MKLSERLARLGTETAFEVLVRARALEAQGRSVVHLEIGEPDFDTPLAHHRRRRRGAEGGRHPLRARGGPARAAAGDRGGLDGAARRARDARDGGRHAGRQADHVLRDPRARRPRRRGALPEPGLPDLRVDDPLHRRRAGARAPARGEGLRPRRRPAGLEDRAEDQAHHHQLPAQPDGRRDPRGGPARDRRRRGAPRRAGAGRRDLLAHPVRRPARLARGDARDGAARDRARRLLEDLRDDRLAARLRRHARPARPGGGEAADERDLVHGHVHAARRA